MGRKDFGQWRNEFPTCMARESASGTNMHDMNMEVMEHALTIRRQYEYISGTRLRI
jgi:hypothetical protein